MSSKFFIVLGIIFVWLIYYFVPFGLYFVAKSSGFPVSLFHLLRMRIRKLPVGYILNSYISAQKNSLHVTLDELEALSIAGGDVQRVITSMIDSQKSGVNLTFKEASKKELNN